jgi:cytochrome c oxidase subunit 2
VRRTKWSRGLAAALLLGVTTLVLSGCSAKDWERDLRFGVPTGVTDQATSIRVLYTWSGIVALVLGIIVWGLIFWCSIVYRKRRRDVPDKIPSQFKYNLLVEAICVIVPLLVVIGLFWRTLVVQDRVTKLSPNPDVMVRVVAFKWNWQFEYLGTQQNGKLVPTTYSGTSTNTGSSARGSQPQYLNTLGTSNEIPVLVVPVGKTVQVQEHSNDVIHSFWVPEFLFKRDVIPYGTAAQQRASGLSDNRFQFHAYTTGQFVGRCSELCGTYHSQMNFEVRVVKPAVFTRYLAALKRFGPNDPQRQHEALAAAKVPGGPFATTTHPFATSRTERSAVGG